MPVAVYVLVYIFCIHTEREGERSLSRERETEELRCSFTLPFVTHTHTHFLSRKPKTQPEQLSMRERHLSNAAAVHVSSPPPDSLPPASDDIDNPATATQPSPLAPAPHTPSPQAQRVRQANLHLKAAGCAAQAPLHHRAAARRSALDCHRRPRLSAPFALPPPHTPAQAHAAPLDRIFVHILNGRHAPDLLVAHMREIPKRRLIDWTRGGGSQGQEGRPRMHGCAQMRAQMRVAPEAQAYTGLRPPAATRGSCAHQSPHAFPWPPQPTSMPHALPWRRAPAA